MYYSVYIKSFNSAQKCEDYFNYLAAQLEIINFIRVESDESTGGILKIVSKIMNFNNGVAVEKHYEINNIVILTTMW